MSDIKKPRLVYYEEGVDSWCPVPENVESIIGVENFFEDGENIEIIFRRVDMTDEEFNNIPEE